ncbi:hypothetical protein BOTNAR_0186g00160 [Botryotinia narcissicola]|uniref:Uncharacterized protein n=1 Tax=Botryotinia narcissicola TaxID=278944 RepID=A0A4Z1INB5_9HELO|nr:hypothetical protein BOTNAR_0186g00160 [Botryotinia narcissicola]
MQYYQKRKTKLVRDASRHAHVYVPGPPSTGRRKKRQCFLIQTQPKSNYVFHHYFPHERGVPEFSRRMEVVEAIKAKFEEKYKMKEAKAIDQRKFVAE